MKSFDTAPSGQKPAGSVGKIAVIVAHGMGQQTRFETMVEVADGIRRAHAGATGQPLAAIPKATARTVSLNDKATPRLELDLPDPDRRIDIYEAYWAPLTEGAIGVIEVIGFLVSVARNRVLRFRSTYQRILFGQDRDLTVERGTPVYLIIALLAVWSLMFINTVIGMAVALKAGIASKEWLAHSLYLFTASVGLLCVAATAFLCALLVGMRMQRVLTCAAQAPSRFIKGTYLAAAFMTFFSILLCVVLTGATMGVTALAKSSLGLRYPWTVGLTDSLAALLGGFVVATIAFALLAALSILVVSIASAAKTADLRKDWLMTTACSLAAIVVCFSLFRPTAALLFAFSARKPIEALSWVMNASIFCFIDLEFNAASWIAIWVVLLWFSKKVREIIVQYPGDVAIYVASQRLDRFDKIRSEIRELCCDLTQGVYNARNPSKEYEYEKVVFVGHSLGSVIVYDTLNRTMLKDILNGEPAQIRERTGGLLTFGSPLGKVAYLFAVQRRSGWNGQEALAHTLQPLIEDYRYRQFPWVNVHSSLDIISGALQDEYDAPNGQPIPQGSYRIKDIEDPEALVPIAHHTHYWRGRVVWNELHSMLK
jgi:hypothetical protein